VPLIQEGSQLWRRKLTESSEIHLAGKAIDTDKADLRVLQRAARQSLEKVDHVCLAKEVMLEPQNDLIVICDPIDRLFLVS
jgi:hypothetical protein